MKVTRRGLLGAGAAAALVSIWDGPTASAENKNAWRRQMARFYLPGSGEDFRI